MEQITIFEKWYAVVAAPRVARSKIRSKDGQRLLKEACLAAWHRGYARANEYNRENGDGAARTF